MASVIYKTLFKVQILHEYYLTNSDETTVFDNLNNKDSFLTENFGRNIPSVSDDLLYELPQVIQDMFSNFHLRLVPDYAGFSVFTEVRENFLADGAIAYKPLVQVPAAGNLIVQLSLKNNLLNIVTDSRINKTIPGAYYFTNEDIITARKFPALSANIPLFDPSYIYEQGELYVDDQGKIFQFDLDEPVSGFGYANTRDQLLVPLQFTYSFDKADNVTQAIFELKNNKGKIVRTYNFENELPLQKVTINFRNNQSPKLDSSIDAITTLPQSIVSAENIYTLNVTVNNTKTMMHKLIFWEDDSLLNKCWAVINIKPAVTNADFCLFNPDGTIKYSKLPDGSATPAPVFEVRLKSRILYWRYINNKFAKLKGGTGDPFLEQEGNNLVSKKPRPSSYLPLLYKDDSDNSLHYLPNPESNDRIIVDGEKFYANIFVPESKMFPLDST